MFFIRIRQLDFGSMPPNRYNNRTRHSSVELKENNRSLCNVIFFSMEKQVIWYPKLQPKTSAVMPTTYGRHRSPDEDAFTMEANDCEQVPPMADEGSSVEEVNRESVEEMTSVCTFVGPNFEFCARLRDIPFYQRGFVFLLMLALVVFSVCIRVNTESALGIFAPISVAVVLFGAFLYRNYREGRLQFANSVLAWLDRCCANKPVQYTWLTRDDD